MAEDRGPTGCILRVKRVPGEYLKMWQTNCDACPQDASKCDGPEKSCPKVVRTYPCQLCAQKPFNCALMQRKCIPDIREYRD